MWFEPHPNKIYVSRITCNCKIHPNPPKIKISNVSNNACNKNLTKLKIPSFVSLWVILGGFRLFRHVSVIRLTDAVISPFLSGCDVRVHDGLVSSDFFLKQYPENYLWEEYCFNYIKRMTFLSWLDTLVHYFINRQDHFWNVVLQR